MEATDIKAGDQIRYTAVENGVQHNTLAWVTAVHDDSTIDLAYLGEPDSPFTSSPGHPDRTDLIARGWKLYAHTNVARITGEAYRTARGTDDTRARVQWEIVDQPRPSTFQFDSGPGFDAGRLA